MPYQSNHDSCFICPEGSIVDEKALTCTECPVGYYEKNNITTKNIGEIILSQIPNVSSQSAIAIMVKFKTIKALLYSLEENRNCMNDIKVGKIGKERRLSKICISNIFKFLVETDD